MARPCFFSCSPRSGEGLVDLRFAMIERSDADEAFLQRQQVLAHAAQQRADGLHLFERLVADQSASFLHGCYLRGLRIVYDDCVGTALDPVEL